MRIFRRIESAFGFRSVPSEAASSVELPLHFPFSGVTRVYLKYGSWENDSDKRLHTPGQPDAAERGANRRKRHAQDARALKTEKTRIPAA